MDEDLVVNSVDVKYSTDLNVWSTAGLGARTTASPSGGLVQVTTILSLASWEHVFFRMVPAWQP